MNLTMNHNMDFNSLQKDIKDFLYSYIKVSSFSDSPNERKVEDFFLSQMGSVDYFKKNPDHYGLYAIADDYLDRNVCYAMVKGQGPDTIVMVHHYDVVTIEDFKNLKDLAFSPDQLRESLLKVADTLHPEAQKDLKENTFMFGRGCADMKGGGSIQYSLLKQYSQMPDFKGNVIVIGVPDEENLSAGMRSAVVLLKELQDKYGLNFKFMINSEPHQRKDFNTGVFSLGSIGKLMPFFYVRGYLAHCGKSFEGLNPVNVMAEIVRRTEANMTLSDATMGECAPGATWLYAKDSKVTYDVSMPLSSMGCLSVLTLTQNPQELLDKVKTISQEAFAAVIQQMNQSYSIFLKNTNQPQARLPWQPKVVTYSQLFDEAKSLHGKAFTDKYEELLKECGKAMEKGALSIIECNFKLVEFIFDYTQGQDPCVVYGLIPPYYPSVSNLEYEEKDDRVKVLYDCLNTYSKENLGMSYTKEYFYTGISDLSYVQIKDPKTERNAMETSMPLFGKIYDVPFEIIHQISMPCINIGPWGKDFHKMTERVNTKDLYERTPKLLDYAVKLILE